MIVYSLLLFTFAALLIYTGVLTMLGKYEMIYDFYICRVTDLRTYCRRLGLATALLSLPLIACGVLMLIKPEIPLALIGLGVLLLGIIGFYIWFFLIQKKYQGGMF